jgi:hypothetical protein
MSGHVISLIVMNQKSMRSTAMPGPARMILHHPFVNDPKEQLKHHVDWTAAYQSDCLDQANPVHVLVD